MKKNSKIRSKAVKESLLDYNNLATTLKENTEDAVRNLLSETVRDTYAKLLSEDDNDDYDEEEVDDTDSEMENDATPEDAGVESDSSKEDDVDANEDDDETEGDADDVDAQADDDEDGSAEDNLTSVDNADTEDDVEDEDGDDWAEFDKYKVSDDEYDFSQADDDEIVKVYKLLKDDDQVMVHKDDDGKVNIKDNETGAEYLVDLGDDEDDETLFDETDSEFEDNEENDMNESTERIFEIALNEYDSNTEYTDNYQSKDVMTTDGMTEPGKNVRDWDGGVPKGNSKPWSGYPGKKQKADQPFNAGKGTTVEEEEDLEEATNVGGFVQQNSASKSHVPDSSGRNARNASKGGKKIKGTANPRYDGTGADVNIDVRVDAPTKNESIMRKANKIFAENKQLKQALNKFRNVLQEAAVTNVNLGQIIKLISENSTSQDEKKEIIARFGKEAKTVEQSKNLYESISNELKKANKMNLTENSLTVNGSKQINETPIYKSNDLMESLDLMHRLCK